MNIPLPDGGDVGLRVSVDMVFVVLGLWWKRELAVVVGSTTYDLKARVSLFEKVPQAKR